MTGWRKGQIRKLRFEHVNRTDRLLSVPGKITKNRKPQTIALGDELWELVERRRVRREVRRSDGATLISPFVFHRGDGKPLGDFRKAWARACTAAGAPGLLFHDLRRSAARTLTRSGASRTVACDITGHKTESMFTRYDITDTSDQKKAFDQLGQYLREQRERAGRVASLGASS